MGRRRRRKKGSKYFFKRMYRYSTNASLAGNTNHLIKAISVSPDFTSSSGATGDNLTDPTWQASQTSRSRYPVLISSYKLEIATNFNGVVFQCVGDNDDYSDGTMYTWDQTNPDFLACFKKYRMVTGGDSSGAGAPAQGQADLVVTDNWHKTTLWYKGLIKLRTPANPDGQTITWAIKNMTPEVRQYYAQLTVKYCQLM